MRIHPLDAVCADAVVAAITNAAGKGRDIFRSESAVDQKKIVAASTRLHEWNGMEVRGGRGDNRVYSRSTRPSEVTVLNMVDAFKRRNSSFCSRLQPSTSNCKRTCWPVLPLFMFCISR